MASQQQAGSSAAPCSAANTYNGPRRVRSPGMAVISNLNDLGRPGRAMINWTSSDDSIPCVLPAIEYQRSGTARYRLSTPPSEIRQGSLWPSNDQSILRTNTRYEIEIPEAFAQSGGSNTDIYGQPAWPWYMYEYTTDDGGHDVSARKHKMNSQISVIPDTVTAPSSRHITKLRVEMGPSGDPSLSLPSGEFCAERMGWEGYTALQKVEIGIGQYELEGTLWLYHPRENGRLTLAASQDDRFRSTVVEMWLRPRRV